MDQEAWQATVHRVTKCQTQLKWLNICTHTKEGFNWKMNGNHHIVVAWRKGKKMCIVLPPHTGGRRKGWWAPRLLSELRTLGAPHELEGCTDAHHRKLSCTAYLWGIINTKTPNKKPASRKKTLHMSVFHDATAFQCTLTMFHLKQSFSQNEFKTSTLQQ